ncbi:MAG TPA: PIG-L family deacetylase [Candidatus Eisenbacteria bacterium]|nr:PIG-L family deacetylase [Candidatus Eisenbacteria bacterium]
MELNRLSPLRSAWLAALIVALSIVPGPSLRSAAAAGSERVPPAGREPDPDWQPREPMNGADLALAMRRLRVLGSALYVAAHPDDENTAFLTYLTQGRLARAGYLSLTRGDGGQNLIGDQIGEALGVIRTHELLGARTIDGAEQYFTRALDFGFSKTADETMEFWGRDSTLADVVRVIRGYRPDVMVLRFPTDGRGGHGHHTASAILAEAAFEAAGDSTRFPEQLGSLRPWRPKRLLWNRFGADTTQAAGKPALIRIDLGGYQPLLGRSYTEIAGESRSMHKSQGFGAPERRGTIPNFFDPRLGDTPTTDLFEGIDLTWNRIKGGAAVDRILAEAEKAFDPSKPQAALPALLKAHAAMSKLGDDPWVAIKRAELDDVIRSCAGLWIEALALRPTASPGGEVRIATAAIQRTPAAITLESVQFPLDGGSRDTPRTLRLNHATADTVRLTLPATMPVGQPYWLAHRRSKGRFTVEPTEVGHAMDAPALSARMTFRIEGERVAFDLPVAYRWTDPVKGERYRPFAVTPAVTMTFDQKFYVFPAKGVTRAVRVLVESPDVPVEGSVTLVTPPEFDLATASHDVKLVGNGAATSVEFRVTRSSKAPPASGAFRLEFKDGRGATSYGHQVIDHAHLPITDLYPPAEVPYVATDIQRRGESIGYVMGSGDEGPSALRQMGYDVTLLTDADLQWGDLSKYHTLVTGVRAWNTRDVLKRIGSSRLAPYVAAGRTLVVQYNTAEPRLGEQMGFGRFTIGRDRVTVEEAPLRMRESDPLLTAPNKIAAADFDGWVQERGLYFATAWDSSAFVAPLSSNDPGEPARDGGLIYKRHGDGHMVYTGYAFFRQLPAGVPGAYRLFANLVSLESAAKGGRGAATKRKGTAGSPSSRSAP